MDEPRYSSPGFQRFRWKRQKVGEAITAEQAKEAIKAILALDEASLEDPTKSTKLPYIGMGRPCSRPGPDINFVGRFTVFELVCDFWLEELGVYLVYGPKGVGKSTDFRAVACIVHQSFATAQGTVKERLVFLWAELLLSDGVVAVRNALFFTFLVDEVQDKGDWKSVQAAIQKIDSMDKAVQFVEDRKQANAEKFHFFVDGGEQLDPMDFYGRTVTDSQQRSGVAHSLNKLLATGARVWWCTSPKAQKARSDQTVAEIDRFCYSERGFSKAEYEKYASGSFLGKLKSDNQLSSIAELTGYVPLFLEAFCACCTQFARELLEAEQEDLKHSALSPHEKRAALKALKPKDVEMLLEEDDNWDAVVRKFAQHEEVTRVRKRAQKIQLTGECKTDEDMAKLDMTYVLDASQGIYCSNFIKRLYMAEVRDREEQLKHYADGAWMEYARRLLSSESINWSTLGHLSEDVLASVIQKKGIILGQIRVLGENLTLQQFDTIPSRTVKSLLHLRTNSGYYFQPWDVSFPHVDAVIVWLDECGKLYILALQFTVNIDRHMKSANQFMNYLALSQWFPDIGSYLSGSSSSGSSSSSNGTVELHYAFVGCSSRDGYSSGKQQGNLRTSRQGQLWGIPPYELHIQPFDNRCFPGLHADDYRILLEITGRRVWKTSYSNVVPEGLGLLALLRRELEKLARDKFGIDDPSPRKFKNKSLLINEMVKIKPDLDV